MATGLTITIDDTIIVVRGFKAGARLKAAGIGKPIYSTPAGGWILDRKRLPDLEAWLESRRIGFTVVDPDQGQLDLGAVATISGGGGLSTTEVAGSGVDTADAIESVDRQRDISDDAGGVQSAYTPASEKGRRTVDPLREHGGGDAA